jgi:hypothetical protein
VGWPKDAPASEEQSNNGSADKKWTVRFKSREISDPCTAQAERDQ